LLLGSAIFMLSSCKKSNLVGASSDQQIWPLKTGDLWDYQVASYDTAGIVNGGGTLSLSITSDTVVAGETWYRLSGDTGNFFYTERSNGFWIMSNGSQALFLKYPGSAGESWNCYSDSVSVQSTDTSVSVPLGTYNCYMYRLFYSSKPVEDYYLSIGVGMVAEDDYSVTSSGQVYKAYAFSLTYASLK